MPRIQKAPATKTRTPSTRSPAVPPPVLAATSKKRPDGFRRGGAQSTPLAMRKSASMAEGLPSLVSIRANEGRTTAARTLETLKRTQPLIRRRLRGPVEQVVAKAVPARDAKRTAKALGAMSDKAFERIMALIDFSDAPDAAAKNRVVLQSVARQSDTFIARALQRNSEHIDVCVAAMEGISNEILAPGFTRLPAEEQSELREMQTAVSETHAAARAERAELARLQGGNFVEARARPHTLKAGQRLYTCKTPERAANILANGIDIDQQHNNFGDAEMGRGLYFDTVGGTYRNVGKMVIVAEVVEDLDGAASKPVEEYRRAAGGPLEDQIIREGWEALQARHPFIRHDALPPGNTEICFRDTQHKIRIVGVVENPAWQISEPRPEDITPIGEYLARTQVVLGDAWRTAPEVVERNDAFVHLRVDGEGDVFWKPSRPNHTQAVRLAEVGGSGLCDALTGGGLVPHAELMRFEGRQGTKQPWVPTTPIIEVNPQGYITRDFDPAALTQRQANQMFCHMVTDFVISNHDNHAKQFGVDARGNLVGFDKAQAFKFFEGGRTRSPKAAAGQGPEADVDGRATFFNVDQDAMFSAYASFRRAMREGEVNVDFDDPLVQDTLLRIATLDRATVEEHLGPYADAAYGDRAADFTSDVLDRAHAILDDVIEFRRTLP